MSTIAKLHSDTASNISGYTGPAGELAIDTTNYQLHIQDGTTAGGRLVPSFTSAPTNGKIPIGNGTDLVAALPTAGSGISVTGGSGTFTVASKYPMSALIGNITGFSTVETYITNTFKIPANTLTAGDSFHIYGKLVGTSSAANSVTTNVRLGNAGTTSDAILQGLTTTAPTGGAAEGVYIEAWVTVQSLGASGTAVGVVCMVAPGAANGLVNNSTLNLIGPTATLTIDTTSDLYLGISMVTGASTTTISATLSVVEYVR